MKLKLVLFVVSLSAMAQVFSGVRADTSLNCFQSISPGSKAALENNKLVVPKSRAGKCLYECMLRSAKVVKQDGLIIVNVFMNKLMEINHKDTNHLSDNSFKMIREVIEKCQNHKHPSGDVCETTKKLLRCTVKESRKRGWKRAQILRIIRAPFYGSRAVELRLRFG